MSQYYRDLRSSGSAIVETLTGNSGGAVPPTGGNINVVGDDEISVVGNPGTSTLTASLTGIIRSDTSTITGGPTNSAIIASDGCTLVGTNSLILGAESVTLTGDNSIACITANLVGQGSFAFGRGNFLGGGSVFLTDQQSVYAPGTLIETFYARFNQGCDLNTVTIANDGTLEASGIENTPIGPTSPSTGNFSGATREGTVSISNLTQNTGTTNTTITSASMVAPILYGAMTEVGFSRLCSIAGNNLTPDSSWTAGAGTMMTSSFGNVENYLGFTAFANGNNLIYTIPVSLTVGVYRVRYKLLIYANGGLIDFAYNPNSLGYTVIRNQIDTWQNSLDNGDGSLQCEDYFSISSGQTGTCLLRWLVNGKNASSGNFGLLLLGGLQVLKLG